MTATPDSPQWDVRPVTADRFEDFVTVINPTRRATHCWCLSHRCTTKEIAELGGTGPTAREQAMHALTERRQYPPGVVAYLDGEPVGWCNIGPRDQITRLSRSKLIQPVDAVPVWSIVCAIVRTGFRRRGVTAALIEGAVAWAASNDAPAVEVYPVDPPGRMDLTMAFVGVRAMYEAAGFRVIGTTKAVAGGLPRLVMRRDIRPAA